MSGRGWSLGLGIAVIVASLGAAQASADVTYVQRTRVKGGGDLGKIDITRTVQLSGKFAREQSTTKFTGKVASDEGAKPFETTRITRLDSDLVWSLSPGEKTYSEQTFPEYRQDLKKIATQTDVATGCEEVPDAKVVVEVMPTSDTRKFGDWDATLTTLTAHTEVADEQTGLKRKGDVIWELWLAKNVPGQDEMRSFRKTYATKISMPSEILPVAGLAGGYPLSMARLMEAYEKLDGFPVAWTWTVRTELSPEERSALADAAQLQEESRDLDAPKPPEGSEVVLDDPLWEVQTRTPESARDKNPPRALEPQAGQDLSPSSADIGIDVEHGITIVLRAQTILDKATVGPIDASRFQLPEGYTRVPVTE